jgi:arylsulfatase A-like enzyme
LDAQLARLIAAFPTAPNVLVVSDHGQEAAAASTMSLWKGWHSSRGVFMAAGPDIGARHDDLAVSYFDIVPTMLDLLSFEMPSDLSGGSLLTQTSTAR